MILRSTEQLQLESIILLQQSKSLFQVFIGLGHFICRLPKSLGGSVLLRGYLIGPFDEFLPMFPVMLEPVG